MLLCHLWLTCSAGTLCRCRVCRQAVELQQRRGRCSHGRAFLPDLEASQDQHQRSGLHTLVSHLAAVGYQALCVDKELLLFFYFLFKNSFLDSSIWHESLSLFLAGLFFLQFGKSYVIIPRPCGSHVLHLALAYSLGNWSTSKRFEKHRSQRLLRAYYAPGTLLAYAIFHFVFITSTSCK